MDARRVFCLLAATLSAACSRPQSLRPRLPAAYGDYRKVDNTLVFELPDTGGYLVNGVPLDTTHLLQLLHEVFDQKQPYLRAAMLFDNPRRPWSELQVLVRNTQAAGVQLFDAERSGWRLPGRWDTIPTISKDSVR